MTTATEKTTSKTSSKTAAKTEESSMADTAREFVKRSTATAKERTDSAYEGAAKFNSGLENALVRLAGGYVGFLGGVVDMAYRNVNQTLVTAEKLADARTLSEATQIQADFVREATSANVEQLRTAYEGARDMITEVAGNARDEVAKVWPTGKKAA